jgi:type I restriction enzyme M protein
MVRPACVWFLCKDKTKHGRDHRGETLFIDTRQLGTMTSRTNRELTQADIDR